MGQVGGRRRGRERAERGRERRERERQLGIGQVNPRTASQWANSPTRHTRNTTLEQTEGRKTGPCVFHKRDHDQEGEGIPSAISSFPHLDPSSPHHHTQHSPLLAFWQIPVLFHHYENESPVEKILNTLRNIHIYQLLHKQSLSILAYISSWFSQQLHLEFVLALSFCFLQLGRLVFKSHSLTHTSSVTLI